ncbi:MAG: hypothetical protein K9L66_11535 [Spirochaetaceae bacterium]|nr:hypothetical protein [Spirochaetaceae bacterium]MCF7939748.1 hypothetical protein [Spirochaetales bacterium]
MKNFKKLALLVIMVSVIFAMVGCDFLLEEVFRTYSVSGEALNVKAARDADALTKTGDSSVSLVGASVMLKTESGTTIASGSVGSTGLYGFDEVEAGKYILTGQKTGWVFVPVYVDISGDNQEMPPLMAYPNVDPNVFTVILAWEDISYDLDLKATVPPAPRTTVDYVTTAYSTVSLDRDITAPASEDYPLDVTDAGIPRVETITVTGAPTDVDGTGGSDDTDIRFFVENYGRYDTTTGTSYANSSITGLNAGLEIDHPSAWATVYAMKGNEHYGTWELPYNTYENLLQVLTMRFTSDTNFTVHTADPDIQSSIRSIGSDGVIGIGVDEIR